MSHDAEATAVEDAPAVAQELVLRQTSGDLAVAPDAEAGDLIARLDVIRDAMQTAMTEGVDYGRIPGIDKPSLFKPGAEKLNVLFQLDVQLDNLKTWGPGDHLTVESKATVFHAPSGSRLGFGEGLCSTREKKYAKRKQERLCPACNQPAVIKGKQEYGGGWLCWKKRDGCGATYQDGDPQIEAQEVGEIDNPELPDLWNTVIKMAEKRARVDAILAVTGASALFTQDAEDRAPAGEPEPPRAAGPSSKLKKDIGPPSSEQTANAAVLWNEAKMTVADQHRLLDRVGAPGHHKQDPLERVGEMSARSMQSMIDVLSEGKAA